MRALEIAAAQITSSFESLHAKRELYEEADQRLHRHDYNYHLRRLQAEGDRSWRLLAWLLREDQQHTPIGAIRLIDGTLVTSQEAINNAFKEYYMRLYRGQAICDTHCLESFLFRSYQQ
ncbi:hypothetical protein NDU88_005597 [Pleurodeles waltl]|uniref:Uncharacterized protein n=1 Tax=Pleurodeles waltl TaxID=8319 RepID=A0AAV7VN31_PLEWA|nr:hypothetical protein NDU88_005597 [Pleurodeles waltl]